MEPVELDVTNTASIDSVASRLIANVPDLNVLINNSGIMQQDHAEGPVDDRLLVSSVALTSPRVRVTQDHMNSKDVRSPEQLLF